MSRTVIIDADGPIYTAACKSETTVPFARPGTEVYDEEGTFLGISQGGPLIYEFDAVRARNTVQDIIESIRRQCKADKAILALSNYENPWRKKLMPWYKAQRKTMRRPMGLQMLREFLKEEYTCYERPTLEGDDVCGILLTMPDPPFSGERILASSDKDMRTLPGLHFHMRARMEFEVSLKEADRWHMVQTLVGDVTDNYKGCPGIGEARAEKLLEQGSNAGEWWSLTRGAFLKAGLTEEYALLHAQIARICRHTEWDFKERKVIPWTP